MQHDLKFTTGCKIWHMGSHLIQEEKFKDNFAIDQINLIRISTIQKRLWVTGIRVYFGELFESFSEIISGSILSIQSEM